MFSRYEDLDKPTRLIWNFRDIGHVIRQTSCGKGSQKRVLRILLESGPVTQTALTEYLHIQPGSASEVLGRLEELGLIRRSANDTDKRTVVVSLTESGTLQAEEALQERNRQNQEMFSGLSEEEQDQLLGLLETLSADWRRRYPDAKGHGRRKP